MKVAGNGLELKLDGGSATPATGYERLSVTSPPTGSLSTKPRLMLTHPDASAVQQIWNFRGAWSSSAGYWINDLVTIGNTLYIAVADSFNQSPPNATYWTSIVDSITNPFAAEYDLMVANAFNVPSRLAKGSNNTLLGIDGSGALGYRQEHVYTLYVAASNASTISKAVADYVCDGTADQTEINAALTALPSVGGKVLLSEGTFTISGAISTAKAGSVIEGMGRGATIVKVVASNPSGTNGGLVNLLHGYCDARNLTVDGTKATNGSSTTMAGVYANTIGAVVENIYVLNSAGYGIFIDATSSYARVQGCIVEAAAGVGGYVLRTASNTPCIVDACQARLNAAVGFYLDGLGVQISNSASVGNSTYGFYGAGGNDDTLTGCIALANGNHGFLASTARMTFLSCEARGNGGAGFYSNAAEMSVIGCRSYLNSQSGIDVNADGANITGNTIKQNAQHGIRLVANECRASDNRISDNSTSSNLGFNGIVVVGNNNQISFNQSRRGAGAARQAYGLQIAGGTANMVVYNDCLTGGVTGNFIDSGTSSVMTGTR